MENKKVLITGLAGFAGSHLAEACNARGWLVYGTIRHFRSDLSNLEGIQYKPVVADLMDYHALADAVSKIKPHYLFHLAAQSYVPESWTAPRQTLDVNLIGTLNVLEAVRKEYPDTVVQVCGTSEGYGMVEPDECPITEDQPLRPLSPYGVSKVAADLLASQYAASYHLRVIVTRAFNHTGARRGQVFAESDWARQIVLAETSQANRTVLHGNLESIRDYTDVRDIVEGYILAVEKGKAGEVYNLCSGQGYAMGEVLQMLCELAQVAVALVPDSNRMRPSDVPRLVGSYDKARSELGWIPKIGFDKTLLSLLDYWRTKSGTRLRQEATTPS